MALRDILQSHRDRRALIEPDGTTTSYDLLLDQVTALAARFQRAGIGPGIVVALHANHGRTGLGALLALRELGAIAVPLTTRFGPDRTRLQALAAAAFVFDAIADDLTALPPGGARPALYDQLTGAGLVLFTGGTTGTPRATLHDFTALADSYPASPEPSDHVILLMLLFDHIGGIDTLLRGLVRGATLVVPPDRQPARVAAAIAKHQVTVLPTSPSFLGLLLASGVIEEHDLSSLHLVGYGAEPMPAATLARLHAALPQTRLQQKFGTSETCAVRIRSQGDDSLFFTFDDPAVEHRIVDDELWLRTPRQMLGYLHQPPSITTEGWYRTGDLVEVAPDGSLRILGRRTDLINVGGEKVSPVEVESVLLELPAITDCVVHGEPNPLTGQIVCARVVPAPEVDPATLRTLVRRHARSRLPAWQVPVKVTPVAATELTPAGKKARRTL